MAFWHDGATPLLVHQDGKIIPFVFPKDTIVLDKFLLAEKEQGRRRFTMAHEASHHILSKMYAMPSEGRFHAEYDSERSYSKEELAQMFASVEWQADTMGASLLMPRRIIENALAKYNQSNPIRVYGDNTITSKDKAVIRRMAAYIGVSYTALVIRLRDMGLFEYHNILEYISNELNLGGVFTMRLQTQVAPEIQKRLLLSRVEAESLKERDILCPTCGFQDTKSIFRRNRTFECEVSEMQECPYLKSRLLPQNP